MNEEEKKAVKYFYNLRATIDESNMLFDEEINVKHGKETIKQITIILNLIVKLQKENEELKNQEATARRINELLVQRYSNSIPVQKVKDNIKKLEIKKEKARGKRDILERFAIEKSINSLQELLYGRNK